MTLDDCVLSSISRHAGVGPQSFHFVKEPFLAKFLASEMSKLTGLPLTVEVRARDIVLLETIIVVGLAGPHVVAVKVSSEQYHMHLEEAREMYLDREWTLEQVYSCSIMNKVSLCYILCLSFI